MFSVAQDLPWGSADSVAQICCLMEFKVKWMILYLCKIWSESVKHSIMLWAEMLPFLSNYMELYFDVQKLLISHFKTT